MIKRQKNSGSPRQLALFLWVISSLCVLLFGCGQERSANVATASRVEARTNGVRGGKLNYRLTSAPKTFNYLLAADEATIVTSFFMLTGRLVEFDHQTQKFVPGLAESWTAGPDGRTIDVTLRDGLKFSDGHALTADDVIFTLRAMYDERTNSPVFRDAMMPDGKPIETKQVDARRLQFTFPRPVPNVESYLTNLGVLPSHVLKGDLEAGKLAEAWKIDSPPTAIVSSGPFVVESATPGESIVYARNPNYWKKDPAGTQLPYLDKLEIDIIPDANNTYVRLSQGSIDMADRIRPADYAEFSKNPAQVRAIDVGPGLSIDHMWFNLNPDDGRAVSPDRQIKRAWFADKRFRQAVAGAIDRTTIASITLQGLASPLYGFVSPANRLWIDSAQPEIKFDLAGSEHLLADAGFHKQATGDREVLVDPQGNPVEFTLIVPAENEARKLTAAVIQEDLKRLGIKMQVVPIDFPAVTERWTKTYDYDAILLGLSQTDFEPSSYSNFLLSNSAAHQWQPKQAKAATEWEGQIDRLFAEQATELDQPARLSKFIEIQKIMRDELPVIPIVVRHVVAAANQKVGNYSPSSILPYSLWNVDDLYVKP